MSELVAPLVVLALMLLAGAVVAGVALRRRRARRSPIPSVPETARLRRAPRPPADRGQELARRPEQLGIRPLTDDERERYRTAWDGVQSRAAQLPALTLCEADAVLDRMLRSGGYPVDDPRSPTDVVPGWHAHVLASFRAGHALEQINTSSRSDAEQVAQGMQHFRLAFEAVIADGQTTPPDAPALLSGDRAASRRTQPGR